MIDIETLKSVSGFPSSIGVGVSLGAMEAMAQGKLSPEEFLVAMLMTHLITSCAAMVKQGDIEGMRRLSVACDAITRNSLQTDADGLRLYSACAEMMAKVFEDASPSE